MKIPNHRYVTLIFCISGLIGISSIMGCRQTSKPLRDMRTTAPSVFLSTEALSIENVSPDPLIDILATENKRWMNSKETSPSYPPIYYLAYRVQDRDTVSIVAEDGTLHSKDTHQARTLDTEVRVGQPSFDNRHPLHKDSLRFLDSIPKTDRIAQTSDPSAIAHHVWLATDRRYREALQQWQRVQTNQALAETSNNNVADFTLREPVFFIEAQKDTTFDHNIWMTRLKTCSLRSKKHVATRATCSLEVITTTKFFVNSENSKIQTSSRRALLTISVGVKTPDGTPLTRTNTFFAEHPSQLPKPQAINTAIDTLHQQLNMLHDAPIAAPYSGPVILQGRAAAVFLHEVFGHRIEGHRQKNESSGQTFSAKIGQKIMPDWLTIRDDPTLTTINRMFLSGHYRYDDEGVAASSVTLVNHGILKQFLMSRTPIPQHQTSNGHGRHSLGLPVVSRQGVLYAVATQTVPDKQLKKLLLEQVLKQKKTYGMLVTDIKGGITQTTRFDSQSFKVNPSLVYQIYPDGREVLVRGIDLEGTPLIALGSIIAAGQNTEVFNGVCGAESGWVPVSAASPSLLLNQIEITRDSQTSFVQTPSSSINNNDL